MAVELKEELEGKLLSMSISGKLTKQDYDSFLPEVEGCIKRHGKVDILMDMHDFHGWRLRALWEDLKFDLKHHADIGRLAMIGDKRWEKWMASFCKPFTSAKIRYFDHNHAEEARAWLHT